MAFGGTVSRRLTFNFDALKFANAAAYLAQHCADLTRMKVSKLLFFADKTHLLWYGRPVLGDRYIKMEFGPVPSFAYNLMKRDDRAAVEDQEVFDRYLSVDGNDIKAKMPPDLNHLSETDLEALDFVLEHYGHLTPAQLSRISHNEPAWREAGMNDEMDYRLLLVDDPAMAEIVQSDQQLRDALEQVKYEELLASLRP